MLVDMSTNEPPVVPDPIEPTPPEQTPASSTPPPPPPPPSYGSYGADQGGSIPPPPPPPAGGGYAGGPAPFSPTDAIGYGWKKFKDNAGQWVIAGLAVFAVMVLFGVLSWVVQPDIGAGETNPFAGFNISTSLVNILSTLVGFVISGVLYRGALDETEGRKFNLGETISRVPLGPVVLTSLLLSVGTTIGLVLCILPGLIFSFLSYFSLLFVVDKNQDPITAIKSSITLISANIGPALLLALLLILIIIAGACLCGLGLLVAYPVSAIAATYAYKVLQNEPVAN